MPLGNIVTSKIREGIRKSMGEFSPYVLSRVGGPLDQIETTINKSTRGAENVLGILQRVGGMIFTGKEEKAIERVKGVFRKIGVSIDGQEDVPEAYKIKISSSNLRLTIVALMQEKTSFRVTSDWEPFLPTGISSVANMISQLLANKALISRFMTRRIWKGTSPVEINMNLVFEAVDNVYRNVVLPCKTLMQMALPSEAKARLPFINVQVPVLAPPGPSPFKLGDENKIQAGEEEKQKVKGFIQTVTRHSDNITIDIGEYLSFESVIIKDVQTTFDDRLSIEGFPIRANVSVTFQTYEIMTKEGLEDVFTKKG